MPRGRKRAVELAKEELKREVRERKVIVFLFVLTIISSSFLFVSIFSDVSFSGFASSVSSKAGDITSLTLYRKFPTTYWAGTYGLALRVSDFTEKLFADFLAGEIPRQDLFFDCIEADALGGNEVYASTSPTISFESLGPANLSEIDSFVGCFGGVDCPSATFVENFSFVVSGRNITGVPGTYTYRYDGQNDIFNLGALSDGANLVYVTNLVDVQRSYNYEKIVNFQLLLPVPSEGNATYYFFTDPNDNCPAGAGIGENLIGTVHGYARDIRGNPIANAEIVIAGVNASTDSSGYYNLSFGGIGGSYNFFARAEGYDDYYSNVTINFSVYDIEKNFTMQDKTPGLVELISGGLYGYVKDEVGNPIIDAKVIFGDSIVYTNMSGYYSINSSISIGEHTLLVLKTGYDNYHKAFNFTEDSVIEHNVVMIKAEMNYEFETGPYTDQPKPGVSQKIIEEVKSRGEDYWISAKQINKEVRKNTFIEEIIGVYNLRRENMNMQFKLSPNLAEFIKMDKSNLAIAPDAYSDLKLTIYGTVPVGVYEGSLTISGDLEQEIPIKIKVVDKKFPIEVLLVGADLFNKYVIPGKSLKYKLSLQNLLRGQGYEVDLDIRLKDVSGKNVYYEENLTVPVENSLTMIKEIEIDPEFVAGDYVLEIGSDYLNLHSSTTVSFVVTRPIYLYSFFGVKLWVIFSIISFLSFVALNIFMYKRYRDRNKRYSIAIDYDTLPRGDEDRVVRLGNIAETHKKAFYEIDKLTTHAIVAGATGMGKSISAQVVIEECLMKDISVLVFDPTAQWSGMLRKCSDKKMLAYYSKFGLKPQDARAFKGNVRMIKDYRQKLDINKYVAPGQIQIFSMNKLTPSEIDIFVANVIRQIFRSDPKESPVLKTLLVFDEVHRLLPKFGGSGKGFLQIERACREFRKWGLGVMLISQVLNDFAGQIKANINTEFQARTLEEGDLERIRTKYGEEFLKSLVKAEVGVIMFQNADYNRGRPYFLNFRPILHSTRRLSDEELEQYNKYNDLLDEIEFQVNELEKLKVDVFDLKMELKLIKDKIMSGSFSVVEIYLEGLSPRVAKEWDKLGKKAPKLKLELIDEADFEEEEK